MRKFRFKSRNWCDWCFRTLLFCLSQLKTSPAGYGSVHLLLLLKVVKKSGDRSPLYWSNRRHAWEFKCQETCAVQYAPYLGRMLC